MKSAPPKELGRASWDGVCIVGCWDVEGVIRKSDQGSHGGFMTVNVLVPVVHIVGALLLFASLGVEWVAVYALGRSPAVRKAERWATICRRSVRWQIAAAAVILASGVAMAAQLGVLHFAWVRVSLVVLLLIAAIAGIVSRSRRRATDLRIGRLWPASVAIRIALALGVSYLMVAKPEIVESLIVMALALAIGAIAATRTKPAIRVSSRDAPAVPQCVCELRQITPAAPSAGDRSRCVPSANRLVLSGAA